MVNICIQGTIQVLQNVPLALEDGLLPGKVNQTGLSKSTQLDLKFEINAENIFA